MAKKKVKKEAPKKVEMAAKKPAKVAVAKRPWAPLSGGFMIVSLLGLIISLYMIKKSPSWALAFTIVFAAMLIASLIALKRAPIKGLK